MNNVLVLKPPFVIKNIIFGDWKKVFKIFLAVNILAILALSVFYIFQINNETSERYFLQKQENVLKELLNENQNLEMSLVQANSFDKITALIEKLNFEKAKKINYIRVSGSQVVTNLKNK